MADDKRDLTRIEDLSEYLHEDDEEVDRLLSDLPPTPAHDLDALPDIKDEDEEGEGDLPPTPFGADDESFSDTDDEELSSVDSDDSFSFSDEGEGESVFGEVTEDDDASSEDFSFGESDFNSDDSSFTLDAADDSFADTSEEDSFEEVSNESNQDDFSLTDSQEETFDASSEQNSLSDFNEFTDASISMPVSEVESAKPSPGFHQESFTDVRRYASSISYGAMTQGGNPPFSVILRNIRFKDECEDILLILKEHGLVSPSNELEMKKSVENGAILISQLSEYSAIYLAHRLRRFDVEVQVGLSEELHPSKSYLPDAERPINRSSFHQNKQQSFQNDTSTIDLKSILVSTANSLPNYQIIRYLGVLTDHSLIDEVQIRELEQVEGQDNMGELYDQLTERMKAKVLRKGGNALLNFNFQMTPVGSSRSESLEFKVTCTGTAVLLSDQGV